MGTARYLLALAGLAIAVPLAGQEVDSALEELEVLARGWTEDGRLSEYPPPLAARVDAAQALADDLGTLAALQVLIATREEAWDLLFDAALALANAQERAELEAATEEFALLQAVEDAARASGTWTLDDVAEFSERRRVVRSGGDSRRLRGEGPSARGEPLTPVLVGGGPNALRNDSTAPSAGERA